MINAGGSSDDKDPDTDDKTEGTEGTEEPDSEGEGTESAGK